MPTAPVVGEHYGDVSIREDITDIIFQITPTDTPVMNITSRGRAKATTHQWQRRVLTTRQDNANFEGAVYTFTAGNRRTTRVSNETQNFLKEIRVSTTLEAVEQAGIGSMFSDQAQVATIELKTDMEHALIQGTLSSGASNAAPRFQGLIEAIETNATTHTSFTTGTVTLAEVQLNDMLQVCWDNGGAPRDWFMNGRLKRRASSFTASSTPYINADEQRVVNTISVYESDFFVIETKLSRDVPSTNVCVNGILGLDRTMLEFALLRPVTMMRTAKIASSTDGVIEAEGCPAWGNASGHYYADGLAG